MSLVNALVKVSPLVYSKLKTGPKIGAKIISELFCAYKMSLFKYAYCKYLVGKNDKELLYDKLLHFRL